MKTVIQEPNNLIKLFLPLGAKVQELSKVKLLLALHSFKVACQLLAQHELIYVILTILAWDK